MGNKRKWTNRSGLSRGASYIRWNAMIHRCYNPKQKGYITHGAKGITVSDAWKNFENFYADMGDPPTRRHQLERINNLEGYSKENCRWATPSENSSNRSTTRWVTIDGVTKSCKALALEHGVDPGTFRYRINAGWEPKAALETPINSRSGKRLYKRAGSTS